MLYSITVTLKMYKCRLGESAFADLGQYLCTWKLVKLGLNKHYHSAMFFNLSSANSFLCSLRAISTIFEYLGSAKCSIMFERFRDLKKVEKHSLWLTNPSPECLLKWNFVNFFLLLSKLYQFSSKLSSYWRRKVGRQITANVNGANE